jgi:uncharacterized protein YggE
VRRASSLFWLPGLIVVGLCSTPCLAASPPLGQAPAVITASGHARVVVEPNRVQVDLTIVSKAAEAAQAAATNAKKSQQVQGALRKALGASASIESSGYSLSPNYTYVKDKGQQLDGYVVRNSLRVALNDVSAAGRIIDAASQAGVGEIGQVHFVLADDSEYRQQALGEATQAALRRAGVMAAALDLRVSRVLSAHAGQAPSAPVRHKSQAFRSAGASASVPTTLLPGGVEIRASATVEVAVEP